jgi:hypothetical protein
LIQFGSTGLARPFRKFATEPRETLTKAGLPLIPAAQVAPHTCEVGDATTVDLRALKAPLIPVRRWMKKENPTDGIDFAKRLESARMTFR